MVSSNFPATRRVQWLDHRTKFFALQPAPAGKWKMAFICLFIDLGFYDDVRYSVEKTRHAWLTHKQSVCQALTEGKICESFAGSEI